MSKETHVSLHPSAAEAVKRSRRQQAYSLLLDDLGAVNASDDVKSFIAFASSIGLSEEEIRKRLPGAFEVCDPQSMSPDLRRLHMARLNRANAEDRYKI